MVKRTNVSPVTGAKSAAAERDDLLSIEVGKIIRAKRLALDLTQKEVAFRVGVSPQQFQKYKKGHTDIPLSRLRDVAETMGEPVSFFIKFMDVDHRTTANRPAETAANDSNREAVLALSVETGENYSEFLPDLTKYDIRTLLQFVEYWETLTDSDKSRLVMMAKTMRELKLLR